MAKEMVITAEGRDKLLAELHELEHDKRDEIGERIRIAREFGDISENSEYDDAKNDQAFLENRINEINNILAHATVIDTPKRSNKVNIGSTVTVEVGGKEQVFTIVGAAEVDFFNGKISNESPVGAALIGHKKGDVVEVVGPTGSTNEFTIVKISHENSAKKAAKEA
ncbi:MAG: transcription elongation factor GreA [Coriobacteriales bacterium]|jgi:transcription elongation factor GreA